MGRGKRTRLATGIYKDAMGIALRISVQGTPREFRRDLTNRPYKDRDLAWLRQERIRRQAAASLVAERDDDTATRFAADVERFLNTISSKGHRINSQGYMAHWSAHFATRQRNEITDLEVQTAFAAIDQSASTKIHIRRALIQFYDALNGKSGYNPGRSIKKPQKDEESVRDLPWTMIEQIFHALPPSRAKARLMVIAYTGLPQKQIAALKPSDLRLQDRQFVAHPRRKGAGVAGRVQPLSDYGVKAFTAFLEADAFGTFQNRQLVNTFRYGARLAGITLPDDARPYDLRHSFLTELARGGADIRDIATLGMHATLEQAARYIKGAGSARATNALEAVPRFRATKKRGRAPISSSSVTHASAAAPRKRAKSPERKPRK
jgi:integrase